MPILQWLRYSVCVAFICTVVWGWTAGSAVAQDEKPTCYKLMKADIIGDHVSDPDEQIRAEAKDWADKHTVTIEAGGTIVVVGKDFPTQTWRINLKTGHAIATQTNPPSSVEITWTVPPDQWCSNQDLRMALNAKAVGEIIGGTVIWSRPGDRWDQTPGSAIEGSNPFGNIAVGRFANGYGPPAGGAISVRPKLKGGAEFITWCIALGAGPFHQDRIEVHYHYQRTDEPPQPPHPPKPPEGCAKTFGKEWSDGSWGHWMIRVTGNKAEGEYTNRSGSFGPGTISGTITGNILEGTWKDAKGHGTVKMTLADDGCSFAGTHTIDPGTGTDEGPTGIAHPPKPTTPPPPPTKMTLEAMKRTVEVGDTVLVPVWLWKGTDVANMNYTVTYNAGVAKTEGDPVSGYLLDDALFTSNPKESGTVKLAFSRSSGISGSGPVANITFRAVGKVGDKTPLTLAVTTINNTGGAIPAIDLIHGEILIVGPGGGIPGDCDGDGVMSTADAWCALQMSVGNMPEKIHMDMDKDGKVTSRDATLILQQRVNR